MLIVKVMCQPYGVSIDVKSTPPYHAQEWQAGAEVKDQITWADMGDLLSRTSTAAAYAVEGTLQGGHRLPRNLLMVAYVDVGAEAKARGWSVLRDAKKQMRTAASKAARNWSIEHPVYSVQFLTWEGAAT